MANNQFQFFDEPYHITDEQSQQYKRDGCILIRNILRHDEVEIFRKYIEDAVANYFEERKKLQESQVVDNYNSYFTQVTNVWEKDEMVKRFAIAKRFAKIAADLMGVKGVRLYHDQALFKEPGGLPTPWHQDQYYWPLDTTNTITMWMPLVDVNEDMGSLKFAVGSQKEGSVGDIPISEDSNTAYEKTIEERGYAVVTNELKTGDATFHAGWTMHASSGNNSTRRREVMTVIYYADGTRIMEPDNKHRKIDMEVFHPGAKPGDLAATHLNPLLYPG